MSDVTPPRVRFVFYFVSHLTVEITRLSYELNFWVF
jgi:hypothetical protein